MNGNKKQEKYPMIGFNRFSLIAGVVFTVLGIVMCLISFNIYGLGIIMLGPVLIIISLALYHTEKTKAMEEKAEEERRIEKFNERMQIEERRIREVMEKVEAGEWEFPAEQLYRQCLENNVLRLDNEFSIRKARQIAENQIKNCEPKMDITVFSGYLTVESLKRYLKKGEQLAKSADAQMYRQQSIPADAQASYEEKFYLNRCAELSKLYGTEKRISILEQVLDDHRRRKASLVAGQEAMKQLGTIYAQQQKKESDWAIAGGIAEGIAGPAAGLAVAANTMANNAEVRAYNESVLKTSRDMINGAYSLSSDIAQIEKDMINLQEQLDHAKQKVALSKPDSGEIWENIKVGHVSVEKKPSGVLALSLPITIVKPFEVDVPEGVSVVVDGTITGKVWFEEHFVGEVFFVLPLYGIPSNMTAVVMLDGMCGRSVEASGTYKVTFENSQNLWIMEA